MTVIAVTILISYPQFSYAGLVIRGGQCSARAFEEGAEYVDQGYIHGLSVNYTDQTSDKNQFEEFLVGIEGYRQYCVAKDDNLTKREVKISLDPIQGDPLHAKLRGKSSNIALGLTKFP
ncbi:MAG: hypothetical protein WA919_16520 [Coleofasciculaceae cyanobacterium]